MKFQVHTFGCKVNTYDSGLVQKNLARHGYTSSEDVDSRIHILNTCAVTAEATKEAVRLIRRLKVKDPFSTVVVTGCAAQVDTGSFENLPGADLVVANSHKAMLPEILQRYFNRSLETRVLKSNIFRKEDLEAGGGLEEGHSRAFLKIQDGCNSFCTYCIIPYARGKSRSISIQSLVNRVNELSNLGFAEVVLTGVHIGDYQDDVAGQKKGLEDLLEALLLRTQIQRFRLTSLEPLELTDRLLDLYQNPRLCPHFHMSIQSASDQVLKDMKRHYSAQDVRDSLLRIQERLPGAFVGMDVITGFPTESEDLFEETYRNLVETPWTRLHVFPYSERKGTRAETFPQLDMSVRKQRARRLRELSLDRFQTEALRQKGSRKQVLVLKSGKPGALPMAVSRDYWTIEIENSSSGLPEGGEAWVEVTDFNPESQRRMEGLLQGRLLQGSVL